MKIETQLAALSATLATITRNSIVGGFGPTFLGEIKLLDRAIAEMKRLRNGTTMGAKVVEAGEHDRRELLVRLAVLTAELARLQKPGRVKSKVLAATSADFAGAVFLMPGQVTRVKQLAAAAVSTEFAEQIAEILDGKATS